MTFVSFPIAHSPHPVNHLSYVILPTYLIPEDDTPDIVSPPTYYVTHTMFRLPETFALLPHLPQPIFGTFVPCIPTTHMHPLIFVPYATQCAEAWPRQRTRRRMSTPPSAPIPYSLVSHETCEDHPRQPKRERERVRHAPGLALRCAHRRRPALAPLTGPAPCAGERMIPLYSYSVVSRETREEGRKGGGIIPAQLKMRRRTHHPTAPSP